MYLGPVVSECARCEAIEGMRNDWWQDLVHDLRCWGLRTAALNLWYRATH